MTQHLKGNDQYAEVLTPEFIESSAEAPDDYQSASGLVTVAIALAGGVPWLVAALVTDCTIRVIRDEESSGEDMTQDAGAEATPDVAEDAAVPEDPDTAEEGN